MNRQPCLSQRISPWLFGVTFACAAAVALAAAPSSVGRIKATEQAIEALRDQVLLPSDATGVLVVTPCRGCTPVSLTASASTQWKIGKEPVSFARLRDHIRTTPQVQLVVFYNKSLGALTRVVATAR